MNFRASPIGLPLISTTRRVSAEVVNNRHTIQVNLVEGVLNLDGVPHKLVQFHFHAPSEERINGKAYSMVAHRCTKVPQDWRRRCRLLAQEELMLPSTLCSKPTTSRQQENTRQFQCRRPFAAERGYFKHRLSHHATL